MNEKQSRLTILTWITGLIGILEILYFIGMITSYPNAAGGLIGAIATLIIWPGSLLFAAYISTKKSIKHSQLIAFFILIANIALPLILARTLLD